MKRFNHTRAFEEVYDRYSPMVYGIALEIAPEGEADEILVATFVRLHKNNLIRYQAHSICVTLLKLTIQTAREQLNRNDIKIRKLENTPMLHRLLCDGISIEDYAKENNMTPGQAADQHNREFRLLISSIPTSHPVKVSAGKHAW